MSKGIEVILRLNIIVVLGATAWSFGCDGRGSPPATGPDMGAPSTPRTDTRVDALELFRLACAGFPPTTSQAGGNFEAAQEELVARERALRALSQRSGGMIGQLSEQLASATKDISVSLSGLHAAPARDALASIFRLGAAFEREPTPLVRSIIDADDKAIAKASALAIPYQAALDRWAAIRLGLAEVAAEHARPLSTSPGIHAEFKETGLLASFPHDYITLTNRSGADQKNCLIRVRLSNATNESRTHFHFAQNWPMGHPLQAVYPSGILVGSVRVGRMTVHDVAKVDVTVWSDAMTGSVSLALR